MGTLSPDSAPAGSVSYRMLRCVALLVVAGVAVTSAEPETQAAISCQECIDEMHKLAYIIKGSAADIEEYLKGAYCPTLAAEEQDFCVEHLANNYVAMLFMIINHFFVDGAQHICLAWGVCHPRQDMSYITCEECIEGMEWVQAYMTDPLWVAEYTLYLEQNFCIGHNHQRCVQLVQTHFPPMHAMAMEQFWIPTDLCVDWCKA